MGSSLESYFDLLYSEHPARYGTSPLLVVLTALKRLPPGSAVLDCAGGQGRNALYAAERGHRVTLVDLSSVAVAQAQDEALRRGMSSFRAVRGDVIRDGIQGNYDLIICAFVLHYYSREAGCAFLKEMQAHTLPGGYNAVATITINGDFCRSDPNASEHGYFSLAELKNLYEMAGWRIGWNIELWGNASERKADGSFARNQNAFLSTRKP